MSRIYERLYAIFSNQTLDVTTRMNAYSKMELIEGLVFIYENNDSLSMESEDDLFLKFSSSFRVLFPEEKESFKERLGTLIQNKKEDK